MWADLHSEVEAEFGALAAEVEADLEFAYGEHVRRDVARQREILLFKRNGQPSRRGANAKEAAACKRAKRKKETAATLTTRMLQRKAIRAAGKQRVSK